MKRFSEQFNKQAKGIRMSAAERSELRNRVQTYMEYHPLPAEMRVPVTASKGVKGKTLTSQPFVQFRINTTFLKTFVPTMVLFVVVAVPVLAERTAPGDVLYPVKVRFNEEIRSQLASSPYEEIEWEAKRIERRIAEARLLASEGKLTDEMEAEVVAAVKEQTDKTRLKIAALKSTDMDEGAIAEITFASTLAVQNEVLEADQIARGNLDPSALATVVAAESEAARMQQVDANPSYEKLLARLETETTRAQELFDSIRDNAADEAVSNVERRLADVARKVATAQTIKTEPTSESGEDKGSEEVAEMATIAATNTEAASVSSSTEEVIAAVTEIAPEDLDSDAASLLREALVDVRKLISFMTNIDVRESLSVEDLVPVTLTDDERYALIKKGLQTALATEAQYEALNEETIGSEKLVVGMEALSALIERIESDLAEGELLAAEAQLEELLALREDVALLLKQETSERDDEVTSEVPELPPSPATSSESGIPEELDLPSQASTTSSDEE